VNVGDDLSAIFMRRGYFLRHFVEAQAFGSGDFHRGIERNAQRDLSRSVGDVVASDGLDQRRRYRDLAFSAGLGRLAAAFRSRHQLGLAETSQAGHAAAIDPVSEFVPSAVVGDCCSKCIGVDSRYTRMQLSG
jgi:hypothetical protein